MRKSLILVVTVLTACASAALPPGGPEDKVPPRLVRVTPDTNAVNVTDRVVSFYFDETINDRGQGAQELDNFFLVSPSDGAAKLSWHRSRIDINPRHGFRPNTAYTITMLPGLADLRSNTMKTGASVVFSTGPTIPTLRIEGNAFDWVAGTPARAYLEAVTPDSIIYLAQADSLGRFTIGPLTPGSYLVRAIIDQNGNRALDRLESFDTLRVTVPHAGRVEMLAAPRDTLASRMEVPVVTDSLTLTVPFSGLLDPTQQITPAEFRLLTTDSVAVPVVVALSPPELHRADSLRAKVTADSLRRADSLAGKPLTPIIAPLPPVVSAKPPPPPPPKPSIAAPYKSVTLKLGQPLKPNTEYRLSTTGLRGINGIVQPSERRFSTPKPPPPKAAPDTVPAATPVRRVPATTPAAPATTPPSAP